MKINKLIKYLLIFIIALGFLLRVYKLDLVPPAIDWDEASNGYDAYSIANYFHDQWGNFLPVVFKSFEDDKNPIHIYITALFVKILGLSDFTLRLPAAIFGTLNILLIFFLAKRVFKNQMTGVFAALFLAISPYALQFSRFNQESTFALFFFLSGLLLFSKGLEKSKFLPWSFISLGLSLLSYHSAKVIVPPIILLLIVLYWRKLLEKRTGFIIGLVLLAIVASTFLFNPALLGGARIQQTQIPPEYILKTEMYKNTHIKWLGWLEIVGQRYLTHFNWEFLFVSGDKIARHSIQTVGEFYKVDSLILVFGLIAMVVNRKKDSLVVLAWMLLAPIPAAVSGGSGEVPHAIRAMFMMGSWALICAHGFTFLLSLVKNLKFRFVVAGLLLLLLGWEFKTYLQGYYGEYSTKYATEWQYGMRQVVEYVKTYPNYSQVFMTDERHQPYIFFLYYLKTPLPDFLNSVYYNTGESRSYNLVSGFEQFHFGDWDPIQSMPSTGVLYILTPSEYDGLAHKKDFDVKKIVKYPSGENAFFIVSAF